MPFCACVCPNAYAYALVKTRLKGTGGSRNENVITDDDGGDDDDDDDDDDNRSRS